MNEWQFKRLSEKLDKIIDLLESLCRSNVYSTIELTSYPAIYCKPLLEPEPDRSTTASESE